MKKILLLSITLLCASFLMSNSKTITSENSIEKLLKTEFCEGFEDGYCEGWKDVKGTYAICPVTPICPIPKIGQSSDSYKDGYNTGFKKGMRDARKR